MNYEIIEKLTKEIMKIEWNGENVWVATEIAEILSYPNPSKLVNYFLSSNELFENLDYIVLSKSELKDFKEMLNSLGINKFKQSPKLVLFFERGLVEFLGYRNKLNIQEIEIIINHLSDKTYIESNSNMKEFKGNKIYTLKWRGRNCWIARNIANVLGYKDKTKAMAQCIISEEFERGVDFEVLKSTEVRELIKANGVTPFTSGKLVTHLTILYKEGLLGFINYAHMPIGKEFRKWLRTEVFNELIDIEVGETVSDNKFKVKRDNLSNTDVDNSKVIDLRFEMMKVLNIVDKILSEEDERKLFYLDTIFENI